MEVLAIPNSGDSYPETLLFQICGGKGQRELHPATGVQRPQSTLGRLESLVCKNKTSAFPGKNSPPEGRGGPAHPLSQVTRSWSSKRGV